MSSEGITILQKSLFLYTFLWDSRFFLLQKNEGNSDKWNHCNKADIFFTARKCLLLLEWLRELFVLQDLSYVLKHKQDIVFFFSMQNIKSYNYIVFSHFFPIIFSWWKICFFPVIVTDKRFDFYYYFRIFSYFVTI